MQLDELVKKTGLTVGKPKRIACLVDSWGTTTVWTSPTSGVMNILRGRGKNKQECAVEIHEIAEMSYIAAAKVIGGLLKDRQIHRIDGAELSVVIDSDFGRMENKVVFGEDDNNTLCYIAVALESN
jgi:hypothetical protein